MEVDSIRIFDATSDDIAVFGTTRADMVAVGTEHLDLPELFKKMASEGDEKQGPASKKIKKKL